MPAKEENGPYCACVVRSGHATYKQLQQRSLVHAPSQPGLRTRPANLHPWTLYWAVWEKTLIRKSWRVWFCWVASVSHRPMSLLLSLVKSLLLSVYQCNQNLPEPQQKYPCNQKPMAKCPLSQRMPLSDKRLRSLRQWPGTSYLCHRLPNRSIVCTQQVPLVRVNKAQVMLQIKLRHWGIGEGCIW